MAVIVVMVIRAQADSCAGISIVLWTVDRELITYSTYMLEKIFHLKEKNSNIQNELLGGATTFMTMAYILAVNPQILGDAGMDKNAVFTATILSSVVAMIYMALMANLPIALHPGMGLNAFFAYTVVKGMGYSWEMALAAVFIAGILFIAL